MHPPAFLKYHSIIVVCLLCVPIYQNVSILSHMKYYPSNLKQYMVLQKNDHSWIKSYLNDRFQYVKVDSTLSDAAHVSIGIPQGAVLGPMLFLLFINDLPKVINNCSVSMSGDVTLYTTGNDMSHIQSALQEDLKCVLTWFRKYRLFVNTSKSICLLVGTPQRTMHHSLVIKINEY